MWPLLIKSLFAQMLILALIVALCFVFFYDVSKTVVDLVEELGLVDVVMDTITQIADQTFNSADFAVLLEEKIAQVTDAIERLPNLFNRVEFAYFMAILAICLYRMLISSADMTVMHSLKEFMTTNAKRPFIWYYVKKANDSFRFVLLQFLIAFPLDLIIFFGSCGFYLLFLVSFKWWTIYPAISLALFMYSFRHALFAFWLPAIAVNDCGAREGFRIGIRQITGRLWSVFLYTFVVTLCMLAVWLLTYFFLPATLATILASLVSFIGFFILKAINLVYFFESNNMPYFSEKVALETETA
jgi:hypothetical protein